MHRPTGIGSARPAIIARTTTLAVIAATGVALAGCTGARPMTTAPSTRERIAAPDDAGRLGSSDALRAQRQLIRRGYLGVAVEDLAPAQARLERAIAATGAMVSRAEFKEAARAEYVLRVPPDQLEPLMDSVATLGEVDSRTVSAEDVTEAVVDAEARLAALRASRDRLTQLLERAGSVQDVISVERELARVQAEIESLDARLQAMKGQVAMSELSVHLRRKPVLGPLGLLFTGALAVVEKLFIWR